MNLKLAIPIVLILAGALAWTFIEPRAERWRARRAAERRRMTERRPRPPKP